MNELQKLFGFMMLTKKRYADPSPLLQSIVDEKGNTISIGNQEDVGGLSYNINSW